ncbi:hypothetical protein BW730_12010 [Tessaracoccus aquimaris]|uniref:Uncharacterized protein n=1 Tax=Tessaracoccus aquimaris TaxID=1332264 RepID=A0A1Q2CPQ5_9ACTN|nr:hypothetical protein [Tessaracoccus aquimaris]AQP48108.1 hypothetical protein BW730_12010 [Tessaracoccus aquimaris]
MTRLTTERLTLRPHQLHDSQALERIHGQAEVARYLTDPPWDSVLAHRKVVDRLAKVSLSSPADRGLSRAKARSAATPADRGLSRAKARSAATPADRGLSRAKARSAATRVETNHTRAETEPRVDK